MILAMPALAKFSTQQLCGARIAGIHCTTWPSMRVVLKKIPYDTALTTLAAKDAELLSKTHRTSFWTALWSIAKNMTVDQFDNFEDVIEKASHLSVSSSLANNGGLPGSQL